MSSYVRDHQSLAVLYCRGLLYNCAFSAVYKASARLAYGCLSAVMSIRPIFVVAGIGNASGTGGASAYVAFTSAFPQP
jgi:hypothetical protein